MRRALTPFWLTTTSRLAGLSQRTARIGLAVFALLLASLSAVTLLPGQADTGFNAGVVDGVRHGGNYYAVAADALRGGGYPLKPVFAFALPTLTVVQAHLPPALVTALLYALAGAVAMAWHARLVPALATVAARTTATALLLLALLPMLRTGLLVVPDVWAGLFVALSLALRRPGQWLDAVALALAAALIRETAILYLLIMAVFAWAEGARREPLGWALAILIFLLAYVAHAHAVSEVVRPLDAAADPFALAGLGLFVGAAAGSTVLALLPLWIAAPVVAVALFGWAAWNDPAGLRALAVFAGLAILIDVFGRNDTPHWALLSAPLLLPGLVFAVEGVRDLIAAARDGRRITVTRIIR